MYKPQTVPVSGSCQSLGPCSSVLQWLISYLLNWSVCLHMSQTPRQHHEWICTAPVQCTVYSVEISNKYKGINAGLVHHTYNCLNHLHALVSHSCNHSRHIHYTLFLHLFQDGVNSYECSRATHTSTGDNGLMVTYWCSSLLYSPAVDHHRSLWWLVILFDATMEGQDGSTILRDTMIRPGGEVVLGHQTRILWSVQ